MTRYEYKVIPAPQKGEKARGARSTADRFALALAGAMNRLGQDGWEYLRADTLPCEERVGLTGKATHFQHMLVFRRGLPEVDSVKPAPQPPAPMHAPAPSLAQAAALLPDDQPTTIAPMHDAPAPKSASTSLFAAPRANGRA